MKIASEAMVYFIKVGGHLDSYWSDSFGGFAIIPQPNNETLLSGTVSDQTHLHDLLTKLGALDLPLLWVISQSRA